MLGLSRDYLADWGAVRDFVEAGVDVEAEGLADADHFVSAGGGAAYTEDGVAFLQQANGNGVEDFGKRGVTDGGGTGESDERERQPFSKHGDVPGAENGQSIGFHFV